MPGLVLLIFFLLPWTFAWAVEDCPCDPSDPQTLAIRQCSLCREAEIQPESPDVFFLKDNSPRKPNRWLALPRRHWPGAHTLQEMSHQERTRFWQEAITKARSLWGDEWGLAMNSLSTRTQCHMHVHIGKLLKGIETDRKVVFSHPSEIPDRPNEGIWIHPLPGGKFHAHIGEQITETTLLR